MAANIDNYDLFNIMSYALNKDNITPDNLSSEEYLYGSFKIILGDKDMEFISMEKIDDTTYYADVWWTWAYYGKRRNNSCGYG